MACLGPFGFENTFAILMRREQARRLGIGKISDLKAHDHELAAGFGPEFMNRPDGYPGLVKAYGLNFAHAPREMDRNLLYQALIQESIDLAAGDSTDGRIAALDLVQLDDDRRYFPPYQAVPLVRGDTLERFPRLRQAFDLLAGQIDASSMRQMNRAVDQEGEKPEDVARRFLVAKGLLRKE